MSNRYLYFHTESDYDEKVGGTYYKGGRIEKPQTFPAYFKYVEGWDAHFCGNWVSCSSKEVAQFIEEQLMMLQLEVQKQKILLKQIQESP